MSLLRLVPAVLAVVLLAPPAGAQSAAPVASVRTPDNAAPASDVLAPASDVLAPAVDVLAPAVGNEGKSVGNEGKSVDVIAHAVGKHVHALGKHVHGVGNHVRGVGNHVRGGGNHVRGGGVADSVQADPKPEFFGYVGVYYGYDFDNPASLTRPGFIYSENLHNQIAVNLALLGARYSSDRVRGTFAIQTGTYPDANYAAEPGVFKNIYEAWGGVRLLPGVWFDAGIFLSHIGLEGPNSRDDLTLTRSIMADNSPYYEAGAKLTYDAGKKWLVSVLAINGWQVIRDRNQNEALGTQVQYRPGRRWLLNSSTFLGEGRNVPDSVGIRLRYFHDFYVTYDPSPGWKVAAAFDIGWQERLDGHGGYDRWHGGALIVRRRTTERTAVVARAEYFYDPAAVLAPTRVGGLRTTGVSLGFDYLPVPRVILRAEFKEFVDANDVYVKRKGAVRTNAALTTLLGLTF